MDTNNELHEGMVFDWNGEEWRIIGTPDEEELTQGCKVWAVSVADPDTDRWFSMDEIVDPHWTDDYGDN